MYNRVVARLRTSFGKSTRANPSHTTVRCFTSASQPRVIFEDSAILVLEKPSGLHTAPLAPKKNDAQTSESKSDGDGPKFESLLHWAIEKYPDVGAVTGREHMPHEKGLLHRLDKDTSGLVLIARTQRAFDSLLKQFSEDKVKKSYIAISAVDSNPKNTPNGIYSMDWEDILKRTPAVAGQSTPKWQLPVEVRVRSKFRQAGEGGSLVKVVPLDAKRIYKAKKITESAYTSHITLLKGGIAGDLPLLASYVSISRGFRHQIRAHLAHVGLAIVGDSKYGSPAGGALSNIPLCLHAVHLSFCHPDTQQPIEITGEVPARMKSIGSLTLG